MRVASPVKAGEEDGDPAFTRFVAGSGRLGGPCGPCLRESATADGRGRGGGGGGGSPCGWEPSEGRGEAGGEGRGEGCNGDRGRDPSNKGRGEAGDRDGGAYSSRDLSATAGVAGAGDAGPGDGDGQCMSTPPLNCHPLDGWWVRTCSNKRSCTAKPAVHCCSGHTKRGGASAGECPPGSGGRAPLMPGAQGTAAQGDSSTKATPQQAKTEQQGPKTKGQRNGRQGREHSNTST